MSTFTVAASKVGSIKLSDGSIIIVRVTVTDIVEKEVKPVGPDFGVSFQVSFTVKSPEELRQIVKSKPLPPADGSHISNLKIWDIVEIVEKSNAAEECLYKAKDGRMYKVSVEVEVTIVARTLEYRDASGNPIYYLRWVPYVKVSLADYEQ